MLARLREHILSCNIAFSTATLLFQLVKSPTWPPRVKGPRKSQAMGQMGLLEGPPAGTGRPGDQSNLGFPGATRKGGFLAWPSWQWIFWLARWVSGLAHLPGICLPEALSCSNSHLDLGLLLRPGPGRVLPTGMYLALESPARPVLVSSSPWPSFPFFRLSGPGQRKQEEG